MLTLPPHRPVGLLALVVAVSPALASEAWPGYRGPALDGAAETARFDPTGRELRVDWHRELGSGYSGIAVADGLVVTLYSDGDADHVVALSPESGATVWQHTLGPTYRGHDGSHDGPIGTPYVADGRVFGLGPHGRLFALDAEDGRELWSHHLIEDFGREDLYYGFGASPAVHGDTVVFGLGAGEGRAFAGFDVASGELLWSLGDAAVDYQSPSWLEVDGGRHLVVADQKRLFGIDPTDGRLLWDYEHQGDAGAMGAPTLTPVPSGPGRLFLKHRSDGSAMVVVRGDGAGGYAVEELWSERSIRSTYSTPVYHDGHLYGITGRLLTCIDADTGQTVWKSRAPGDGFVTRVGGYLVIQAKAGGVHVARATPDGYQELARVEPFDDLSWTAPSFAGGHVYLRSLDAIARVGLADVTTATPEAPTTTAAVGFEAFVAGLSEAPDPAAAIDAYLARQDSFPIVEPPDRVHFVYRGAATDVGFVGDVIGARREDPMTRVPGTDLFYFSARLEPDARVVYGFITDYEETITDPLNPRTEPKVRGAGPTSWVSMPARRPSAHASAAPESRRGRIESHSWTSEAVGSERTVEVYLPAGYDAGTARYPVLYVVAGRSALAKLGMRNVLDHVVGADVASTLAVFVPVDAERGFGELLGESKDAYASLIATEVVPFVDGRFRTRAVRASRAVVGAGYGGYSALYTAFSHPDVFGGVASQSAVMWTEQQDALLEHLPDPERHPMRLVVDWGTWDLRAPHEAWDMRSTNRDLIERLRERGYRPGGTEVASGFAYGAWQDRLDDVLRLLLPAPTSSR